MRASKPPGSSCQSVLQKHCTITWFDTHKRMRTIGYDIISPTNIHMIIIVYLGSYVAMKLWFLMHQILNDPVIACLDMAIMTLCNSVLDIPSLSLRVKNPTGLGIPLDPTSIVTKLALYPASSIDCIRSSYLFSFLCLASLSWVSKQIVSSMTHTSREVSSQYTISGLKSVGVMWQGKE